MYINKCTDKYVITRVARCYRLRSGAGAAVTSAHNRMHAAQTTILTMRLNLSAIRRYRMISRAPLGARVAFRREKVYYNKKKQNILLK